MAETSPNSPDERILDTMILLARAARSHRVIVAGSSAFDIYLGLLQRGFSRTATTVISRIPCGQYDVALIAGDHSIQALEALLTRIVPFLNTRAALAIWVGAHQPDCGRKLQSAFERLGFRVEAGTRCENGLVLTARRQQLDHVAKAA
jgi:hypothetical protein